MKIQSFLFCTACILLLAGCSGRGDGAAPKPTATAQATGGSISMNGNTPAGGLGALPGANNGPGIGGPGAAPALGSGGPQPQAPGAAGFAAGRPAATK